MSTCAILETELQTTHMVIKVMGGGGDVTYILDVSTTPTRHDVSTNAQAKCKTKYAKSLDDLLAFYSVSSIMHTLQM